MPVVARQGHRARRGRKRCWQIRRTGTTVGSAGAGLVVLLTEVGYGDRERDDGDVVRSSIAVRRALTDNGPLPRTRKDRSAAVAGSPDRGITQAMPDLGMEMPDLGMEQPARPG
jgi:hypothetical protein